MKSHNTIAGKIYTVTSPSGCTVTDETGLQLGSVEAGEQKSFVATGAQLSVDDDAARVTLTFKRAALALGLLGGGVKSELPAGYLRAEFLESTKAQYIDPEIYTRELYKQRVKFVMRAKSSTYIGCYRANSFACQFFINSNGFPGAAVFSPSLVGAEQAAEKIVKFETADAVLAINGSKTGVFDMKPESEILKANDLFLLFARSDYSNEDVLKSSCAVYIFETEEAQLLPSVSSNGTPCMYDSKRKKEFNNLGTGQFIVGFTLTQACKLGKHLPAGGGSLTISLPTGYDMDAAVTESLETARAKGWTLTVQTYEAEAAVTTFGMRRVWVRRVQDEHGAYVDADGVRWAVDWCADMVTPDGSTPDEHGYELYRSTEAAVAYWELTAWADPEAEELLTTENL